MALDDQIKGKATDDKVTEAKGDAQQLFGKLKDKAENVVKDAKDKI